MKICLFFVLFMSTTTFLFGQKASIDLTFTAQSGTQYQQLDSIKIINIDQGADTTLYWNDTVLTLTFTVAGIGENIPGHAKILVEYPNSMGSIFLLRVFNPEHDRGMLSIYDLMGRECAKVNLDKGRGWYSFRFTPGRASMYVASVTSATGKESVKLINAGLYSQTTSELIEIGFTPSSIGHEKSQFLTGFQFSLGDSLHYKGYANNEEVVINDNPSASEYYTFQFPAPGPCQGIASFTYGGQVYHTVEIGTQCVMKENLNIGTYVESIYTGSSHSDVTNNGIIEKYCYDNDSANCAIYGGLYDWNEMMQYDTTPGIQGICPAGWHIPIDAEWTTLANYLGGTSVAGGKLKETGFVHWDSPNAGATNSSGFTAFGASYRYYYGEFGDLQIWACFHISSQNSPTHVLTRNLNFNSPGISQINDYKTIGSSLRCFKD